MNPEIKILLACAVGLAILAATALFPRAAHADKSAIETEALKLQGIANTRNLTNSDLTTLEQLTGSDETLSGETSEAKWMIVHNYSRHVEHTLNAVYWLAKEGKWVCPADQLSHVAIYLEFNETQLAQQAAREGEEALPEWEAKVKAAKAVNQSFYPNSVEMIRLMRKIIEEMKVGNYSEAKGDSLYLDGIAYC